MFIQRSQSGYTRNGEQFARGRFLLVFSHNQYKWEEENNKPPSTGGQSFSVATGDGFTIQRICSCEPQTYYTLRQCPVHCGDYKRMPADLNRKLYACVRHVSLRQLGNFMMGSTRIGGYSITVSGAYGSDGLPRDYEQLPTRARALLTLVPADLAEVFWHGGGHNSAGPEAPAMKAWALQAFKPLKDR